jgi:hypothetical protein
VKGQDELVNRREISKAYKERRIIGGVYRITNTQTGRYLQEYAVDVASLRNRFAFALATGSAVDPRLRADWDRYGPTAFNLEVLDELEKPPEQSQADFVADLQTLEQLRRAGLAPADEY